MSEKFKVWRTDVEDEAVTHELETFNAYEAARKFAEEEFARDEYESITFAIEDSRGQQFEASADVEMEPTFDIGCVRKRAAPTAATVSKEGKMRR